MSHAGHPLRRRGPLVAAGQGQVFVVFDREVWEAGAQVNNLWSFAGDGRAPR